MLSIYYINQKVNKLKAAFVTALICELLLRDFSKRLRRRLEYCLAFLAQPFFQEIKMRPDPTVALLSINTIVKAACSASF